MDIIESVESALGYNSAPDPAAPDAVTAQPAITPEPVTGPLDKLADAIHVVAPHVDADAWTSAGLPYLRSSGITTARRIAAFIANCSVESGGFRTLSESTNYTSGERLIQVFGSHFSGIGEADMFAGHPEAIANRVYANRLGNGNELSGDGYRFRGRGLVQCTGRTAFTSLAAAIGKPLDEVPDWCATPAGAFASACWFWSTRNLNALADGWRLSLITARVNGPMMLGNSERQSLANAALKVLGGS
jgi:putative chitinase